MIKFTRKYLKELCIGGLIAQKANKNHGYSIYRMINEKLWRKKTFSMRSIIIRRDHILNEIVHSGLISYHHERNILLFSNSFNSQFSALK